MTSICGPIDPYEFSLDDDLRDFLEKRQYKETSIRAFFYNMRAALRYLAETGMETDPHKIGKAELIALAQQKDISESYRRTQVVHLKTYVEWATGKILSARIRWPGSAPKRTWISEGDMKTLLSAANELDRMILLFGGSLGLRRSEISGVRVGDIDFLDGTLTVTGKGSGAGKTAVLPIPGEVLSEINKYMGKRGDVKKGDPLLLNTRGDPLKPNAVYERLGSLGKRVGIKVTPHALRRLFATMLSKIVSIDIVSILMRHSNIATTVKYIEKDEERMRDAMGGIGERFGGFIYE